MTIHFDITVTSAVEWRVHSPEGDVAKPVRTNNRPIITIAEGYELAGSAGRHSVANPPVLPLSPSGIAGSVAFSNYGCYCRRCCRTQNASR